MFSFASSDQVETLDQQHMCCKWEPQCFNPYAAWPRSAVMEFFW